AAAVEAAAQEILADAFHLVGTGVTTGVDRAFGIRADDRDRRIALLQVPRRAADGAARADAGDEHVDATFGLLPDLRAGGLGVGRRVGRIGELVGLERPRDLARCPLWYAIVAARSVSRASLNKH